ncbi:MAG: beta strand repeat-containing protein, partial [Micromonosporaceae bacterium]
VTGSGTTYNVAVSGMTTTGSVTVSVGSGVATDAAGNGNTASNTGTVTWDVTAPTVTIDQAGGQADPANTSPINFSVVFSESVTGFGDADVILGGTAGGTLAASVTGSGTTYNVAVSGMTTDGTVIASVTAGAATDAAGNPSGGSTSTDNTVTWDGTAPTVTVDQAAGQPDPDNTAPVNFTVVFSEVTTNFADADVTITGSAGGTKSATVTGSGTTYNVAVSGMTTPGTVVASLNAGVATDSAGNGNQASTSTDNTVDWDATAPTVTVAAAAGQADPTNTAPVNFSVVFSEPVTGFADNDVTVGGTAGGTKTATVTGSGTTYNVAVNGMTSAGTVTVSIGSSAAVDAAGNGNTASNTATVNWDATAPTLDHIEVTYGSPNVLVVFSEPILCSSVLPGDFLAAIGGSPTSVSSATCSGGSDAGIDLVLGGSAAEGQSVTVSLLAGTVTDAAGNGVTAASRTAASLTFSAGSTADGATVGPGEATYEVTATDGGTIAGLVVLLDGSGPSNTPVCAGVGTSSASCTYDATLLEPLPGAHTFTFTATDNEGNVTTTTRTVTVNL